ncbi:hypothetical protein AMEX_G7555 [Astyanax mexicanus]|uniref:Uncharacterized protein n=1 Tax=Astyanax mexicanus TaxID=7994 RepID=A0A8T2LZT8_ASTMX|nr:hypothetical protein AMEX_G7555 [Astyanax mexicanus]
MREGELQSTGLRQEIHRLHSPGRAAETSALEDPQKAATLTADRCPDLTAHSLQPPNLSSSSWFKRGNRTPLSALPLKAVCVCVCALPAPLWLLPTSREKEVHEKVPENLTSAAGMEQSTHRW